MEQKACLLSKKWSDYIIRWLFEWGRNKEFTEFSASDVVIQRCVPIITTNAKKKKKASYFAKSDSFISRK